MSLMVAEGSEIHQSCELFVNQWLKGNLAARSDCIGYMGLQYM